MIRFPRLALIVAASIMSILLSASSLFAADKTTVNYRPELGSTSPKLDIYSFDGAKNAPVLIYVHGGAWKWGHRIHVNQKPVHFNKSGFVFVSIDYRLVPSVRVEDQLSDIDHALGWIAESIGNFGGDGKNLHLMGHSAGAHLVSMTGVAPGKYGRQLIHSGTLRTIISNDTMAYDLPELAVMKVGALARGAMLPKIYQDVFWQDEKRWRRLSPQHQIDSQRVMPAFLIMFSGQRNVRVRTKMSLNFASLLRQANLRVAVFDGSKYSHRHMTVLIGVDDRLTKAIDEFLVRYSK